MDTIDRKGDVIITRGDTVANGRDGGGKKAQRKRETEHKRQRRLTNTFHIQAKQEDRGD